MAAVSAVTAILALGYGVYSGEEQKKQQKGAIRDQRSAQQQAQNLAVKQERVNRENFKRADQRPPNVAALLAEQQLTRPPATLLSNPSNSKLGL